MLRLLLKQSPMDVDQREPGSLVEIKKPPMAKTMGGLMDRQPLTSTGQLLS